jgi:hypothetical protein
MCTDRSHRRYIKTGRGKQSKGVVVTLMPTFGRAKDPPMSLKAGKDVRLATYCPPPFHKIFLYEIC